MKCVFNPKSSPGVSGYSPLRREIQHSFSFCKCFKMRLLCPQLQSTVLGNSNHVFITPSPSPAAALLNCQITVFIFRKTSLINTNPCCISVLLENEVMCFSCTCFYEKITTTNTTRTELLQKETAGSKFPPTGHVLRRVMLLDQTDFRTLQAHTCITIPVQPACPACLADSGTTNRSNRGHQSV